MAYITVPADMYIYTLYPHSHYRGYHVELMQKDAAGKETMLLSLPKYDFNWQRDYDPVEPILVKKGTKLIATWVFDNSTNNKKLNASNKDREGSPIASYNDVVRTGEQSHQEMMYFRINYRWADETVDNMRNDLQQQLQASMSFGMIDDNYDGQIQEDELKGMMASVKPRFKSLDTDNSGAPRCRRNESRWRGWHDHPVGRPDRPLADRSTTERERPEHRSGLFSFAPDLPESPRHRGAPPRNAPPIKSLKEGGVSCIPLRRLFQSTLDSANSDSATGGTMARLGERNRRAAIACVAG